MSFTHKSLAFIWLLLLGFAGLAGSGVVAGPWLMALIAAALVMPTLISGLNKAVSQSGSGTPLAPVGPLGSPARLGTAV
jgi:hypothetical protein